MRRLSKEKARSGGEAGIGGAAAVGRLGPGPVGVRVGELQGRASKSLGPAPQLVCGSGRERSSLAETGFTAGPTEKTGLPVFRHFSVFSGAEKVRKKAS